MDNFRRALLAAVVCCVPFAAVTAQESAPPPADPIIDSINAELDRGVDGPDRPSSIFDRGEQGTGSPLGSFLTVIAALCIVVALLLGISYGVRRWGKNVPMLAGPNLAKVLGRVYLDRGTALHFVRIGDRVLVIGVTGNALSTVGDFSAAVFERSAAAEPQPGNSEAPFNPDSFLAELQERSRDLKQAATLPRAEEDEIAALRGDIQRLQRYLRDENRGQED